MHHDPSVFSDPETFTHKRFLDTGLERSPSFAPFGHGPRNCVAQGMAMQQISAIIAGLLDDHKVLAQQGVFPEMQQQPFLVPAPFKVVIEKA
jgi:cytochrome P450